MAREIVIEVPTSDADELSGLPVRPLPIKRMQGVLEYVEVVATLSAAVTPLIAAFLTRPSKSPTGKRRVILDGQRRTFENYDADEVVRILERTDEDA